MPPAATPSDAIPDLDVGINLLETTEHRTTAFHQLVLTYLHDARGTGIWFDARGNAATSLLDQEHCPTPTLEIARAFTAYQHYELVRTLPGDLPPDLSLVVLPCVDSLYADPDVPEWRGERYLDSALAILREVAEVVDVPILVSSRTDSPFVDDVRAAATKTITAERTALGYRYESAGFETLVYWGDGFWQTTIPYWVDLLGAVEETEPALTVADQGLLPGTV